MVRTFWHGDPLSPYHLLCLRTFVDRGYRVEVFSYDPDLRLPQWLERRDADEILPAQHVLRYRTGFGRGSPALHSNLFRYAILHRVGEWWTDCDVLLLQPRLPDIDVFVAWQDPTRTFCDITVLRFPAGHDLLAEAIERCHRLGSDVTWGETGARLLTPLLDRYGLVAEVQASTTIFPIGWRNIAAFFDPNRAGEVAEQCAGSLAVHLFNEVWRGAGVAAWLGPPRGSFLDRMFEQHDTGVTFSERMRYAELEHWIDNRNRAIIAEQAAEQAALAVESMRASTSWKITAPLRSAISYFRGQNRQA